MTVTNSAPIEIYHQNISAQHKMYVSYFVLQMLCRELVELSTSALREPEDNYGFRKRNNIFLPYHALVGWELLSYTCEYMLDMYGSCS